MDTLGTFQLGDFKSHMENGMFHQNLRKHQQVSPMISGHFLNISPTWISVKLPGVPFPETDSLPFGVRFREVPSTKN